MALHFGIDILLQQDPIWKKDRIAMLTNDAARTTNGIISRLALKNAGVSITGDIYTQPLTERKHPVENMSSLAFIKGKSIEQIQKKVADHFNIKVADLKSNISVLFRISWRLKH